MKRRIDWSVDQTGIMLGPSIHDGVLIEFRYRESNSVHLRIMSTSSTIIDIEFLEILELGGFISKSTILSEIYAWKVAKSPLYSREYTDNVWNILFFNEVSELVSKRVNQIKERYSDNYIVNISSSYGGSMSLICKSITIEEVDN